MGKWYLYDSAFGNPLELHDLVRGAELVRPWDFVKHPGSCEWIQADDMWFVRFADGSVGGPLETHGQHLYGHTSVDLKVLLEAGILTQVHMDEMVAEREAHRLKQENEEREDARNDLCYDAVERQTQPLQVERKQLAEAIRGGVGTMGDDELLRSQHRIQELDAEIERVEALPLEQLLSAEELTSYQALEPTPVP